MRAFQNALLLGAACAAFPCLALATPIVNNGSAVGASTVGVPSGTLLATTSGTLNSGTFIATYTESVYQATNNVFGSGDLTFVVEVTNDPNAPGMSNDSIERIATGLPSAGFANFSVDAGYEAGTGPQYPLSISEVNGALGFNFNSTQGNNSIAPGQHSAILVIDTDATNYTMGNLSAQDSLTANAVGYIPAAATPEPSSFMLLGTGMIGAAGMLRKRRRNVCSNRNA